MNADFTRINFGQININAETQRRGELFVDKQLCAFALNFLASLWNKSYATMINTLLFDLDGTLVQHGHTLMPPILAQWGFPRDPAVVDDAVHRQIDWVYQQTALEGGALHDDVYFEYQRRLLADLGIPDPDDARARQLDDYFATQPVPPLFNDTLATLDALDSNLKLGLITQRGRGGATKFLREYDLLNRFDAVICGDDGHGRKPTAGPFQAALALLDSHPNRALFVGDRIDDDCEGAHAVGLRAFLIDRDGRHVEASQGREDFVHLRALTDLLPHLSSNLTGATRD